MDDNVLLVSIITTLLVARTRNSPAHADLLPTLSFVANKLSRGDAERTREALDQIMAVVAGGPLNADPTGLLATLLQRPSQGAAPSLAEEPANGAQSDGGAEF